MIRLYLTPGLEFEAGLNLRLEPEPSHYLASVMRRGVGDEILVFNGRDGEYLAKITEVNKKAVSLSLIKSVRPQPQAHGPVLAQALIKRAPLETIVEKATELGVGQIQLLITRRTQADHTNQKRLSAIATEASEQTERLDVPQVNAPLKLETYLSALNGAFLIFADETSVDEPREASSQIIPIAEAIQSLGEGSVHILIGPEGGFDAHERALILQTSGVMRVNMGPRILRADTAALSALALYQALKGDWRP